MKPKSGKQRPLRCNNCDVTLSFFFLDPAPHKWAQVQRDFQQPWREAYRCYVQLTSPRHQVLGYRLFRGTRTRETAVLYTIEVLDVGVPRGFIDASKTTSYCQRYRSLEHDPVAGSKATLSSRHERDREVRYSCGYGHSQNNLVLNVLADYQHRPRKGGRHERFLRLVLVTFSARSSKCLQRPHKAFRKTSPAWKKFS